MRRIPIYVPIVLATLLIAALSINSALATPNGPPEEQTICHKPGTPAEKTMTLPQPAAEAHLRHEDIPGPCGVTPTPTPTPTPTAIPLSDLIVNLPLPPFVFNCDFFTNVCDHVVRVVVQNIGAGPSGPSNVLVTMSNGLATVVPIPPPSRTPRAVQPGEMFTIDVGLGRAPNCLDLPTCTTTAQVDIAPPMNVESNETNNSATRVD